MKHFCLALIWLSLGVNFLGCAPEQYALSLSSFKNPITGLTLEEGDLSGVWMTPGGSFSCDGQARVTISAAGLAFGGVQNPEAALLLSVPALQWASQVPLLEIPHLLYEKTPGVLTLTATPASLIRYYETSSLMPLDEEATLNLNQQLDALCGFSSVWGGLEEVSSSSSPSPCLAQLLSARSLAGQTWSYSLTLGEKDSFLLTPGSTPELFFCNSSNGLSFQPSAGLPSLQAVQSVVLNLGSSRTPASVGGSSSMFFPDQVFQTPWSFLLW